MESSKKNPIAFFESFIVNGGLELSKNEYIEDAIHSGVHIININHDDGVITFLDVDEKGKTIENIYKYNSELKNILCHEFSKSKKMIDEAVLDINLTLEPSKEDNYFQYIQRTLQYILNKGESKIMQFPILLNPIEGISNYINEKYRIDNKIVLQIPIFKTSDTKDELLLCQILGYLKGENDKREKIMSDEQYDLMISYVSYFIENNNAPENIQKFPALNKKVSKNLLRFTFWVLHKHLYTTNTIKDDFLHLIKNMFHDFDKWEFSTLKIRFGSKDKVTVAGKKFIPEIIKIELKKDS